MGRKASEKTRLQIERDIAEARREMKRPVRLSKPHKGPCRGCYWGKDTGTKITCFWQKCRKGGRV